MPAASNITQEKSSFIVDLNSLREFDHEGGTQSLINARDIAEYSAEMLSELRDLANKAELTFLAYLIQVAEEEARIQVNDIQSR